MKTTIFTVLTCCLLSCNSSPDIVPWIKLVPATKISSGVFSASKLDALNEAITDAWLLFKATFKPMYLHNTEHDDRFKIFSDNFVKIFLHNRDFELGKVSYSMGINHLSDRTVEELRSMRCLLPLKNRTLAGVPYTKRLEKLPDTVDWRKRDAVTSVKNQGNCGSCWAFSATGAIEGQYARQKKHLVSFSEQQLVDCSLEYGNNACQGGLMDNAFKYVKEAGGITTEEEYPYVSGETGEQNPECSLGKHKIKAKVTGYKDIHAFDMEALQTAVASEGPISIAINAGLPSFPSYHSGVYSDKLCSGDLESLDHGVLLVGYGEENGVPYWLIKNSWGGLWGDQGYVKILRNAENMCGVTSFPSFPTVESND